MDNIIEIPSTKKTFNRILIEVVFVDDTTLKIPCTSFGNSIENGNYVLFSNSHPDSDSDTADIPDFMVNSDHVKYMRTISVEKVER